MTCDGVFAMGWEPYGPVPVTEITLEPGDRLLFYTDGLTERFSERLEPYGSTRLLRQLEQADGPLGGGCAHGEQIGQRHHYVYGCKHRQF